MKNFTFDLSTKLYFGSNMLDSLGDNIKQYTQGPILLTYGSGSIKFSGLYDKIINILDANDIEYIELSGIKPNPEVDTARYGIELIKKYNIDFILAAGGGSVLDNSKHMAIGAASESDIWDIIIGINTNPIDINRIPNIGSIITVAATGSEMNSGGVMTNPEYDLKLGYGHPKLAPKFTYEDPTVLETLPEYQRRAGLCDILSHLCENYFGSHSDDGLDDRLVEAIMKNTLAYGNDYLTTNNYDSLANIFYSSTLSLNGLTRMSRPGQDWLSHGLEHEISAFTDLTHGIGLGIIHPKVLKFYYNKDVRENNSLIKFENLGVNVFDLERNDPNLASKCLELLTNAFKHFAGVSFLEDVGIVNGSLDNQLIANRVFENNHTNYYKLSLQEVEVIVETFYQIITLKAHH